MKVPIPPFSAEIIGLCHQALSAAREYARSLAVDPELHRAVQLTFNHVAADCTTIINRLDARIPKDSREAYLEQVVQADPLALDNIKQLYIRMLPDQRLMFERVAEAILKKEFILEGI